MVEDNPQTKRSKSATDVPMETGSGADHAFANGVINQARTVMNIQLAHQIQLVRFDRLDAQREVV